VDAVERASGRVGFGFRTVVGIFVWGSKEKKKVRKLSYGGVGRWPQKFILGKGKVAMGTKGITREYGTKGPNDRAYDYQPCMYSCGIPAYQHLVGQIGSLVRNRYHDVRMVGTTLG